MIGLTINTYAETTSVDWKKFSEIIEKLENKPITEKSIDELSKKELEKIMTQYLTIKKNEKRISIGEARRTLQFYLQMDKYDFIGLTWSTTYRELMEQYAKGNIQKELEFRQLTYKEQRKMAVKLLNENIGWVFCVAVGAYGAKVVLKGFTTMQKSKILKVLFGELTKMFK